MALLTFFVLVFMLSIPFWLGSTVVTWQVSPGLPVSAFAVVCPVMAASILVYKTHKSAGVRAFLTRSFDYERVRAKAWYAPVVLVKPTTAILAYGVLRWTGAPLPDARFSIGAASMMFVAFFLAALGEELGWSGYATDPMQSRWGALGAGVLLGFIWSVWHWVPLVQASRSSSWIAWWSIGTVADRVLLVWIYNNTGGSVFASALFHAFSNLSWQLFPSHGSHWDPRLNGLITAAAAAFVVAVWRPSTLVRSRRRIVDIAD
jgi:membrane protease YdiL (CAAX protease family)